MRLRIHIQMVGSATEMTLASSLRVPLRKRAEMDSVLDESFEQRLMVHSFGLACWWSDGVFEPLGLQEPIDPRSFPPVDVGLLTWRGLFETNVAPQFLD